MKKRGEIVWNELFPWIIGAIILIISLIAYSYYSGNLANLSDFFKNLLRFGR